MLSALCSLGGVLWIHLLSASDTSLPSAKVMGRFFENRFISAERVIYNEMYEIKVVLRARGTWVRGTGSYVWERQA